MQLRVEAQISKKKRVNRARAKNRSSSMSCTLVATFIEKRTADNVGT